ncbi:DNA topoisomerase 2-alpha-like isoform X2 [Oscarella lobularis]|uniref:DNA topoisomerase 2-alpha-like isoform X2 n=1 Tax=Oscarella lobularis TaxID=121494 RepID=UPI00331372B1
MENAFQAQSDDRIPLRPDTYIASMEKEFKSQLNDANFAGGEESANCTLILTDRNSGKTLAVCGLSVVGRNHFGVYHLRRKMLNVFEATNEQIEDDAEMKNIVRIVGLEYSKDYSSVDDLKALRYGRLMIMTDHDEDGTNMKGLLIRFLHHKWPLLLRLPFLEQFIAPRVKVFKGQNKKAFYSISEFDEWEENTLDSLSWRVKHYRGLGTSTANEAKEYFQDLEKHRVLFRYCGSSDDAAITLAFARGHAAWRKRWLNDWLAQRKQRRQAGKSESFSSGSDQLTFSNFVNEELAQFANAFNDRSIPSLVDGLTPAQRRVVVTCSRQNGAEINVVDLAGIGADLSSYNYAKKTITTCYGLAQNFVGANNINLIEPIGQFGTRLRGGKDAASPRCLFTALSSLARLIISPLDEPGLTRLCDDDRLVEPEWLCPIIPMVLVNGAEGIGREFSSFVPNYDAREIVANLQRMLDGVEPIPMVPSYKGFTGKIRQVDEHTFTTFGTVTRLDDTHLEITELPVGTWTETYIRDVLESRTIKNLISDYTAYYTDTTVRFVVTMTKARMDDCKKEGFHKKFKLESTLATNNLVLFDSNGCLKKYANEIEILKEFFDLRLERYALRKRLIEGLLKAKVDKLTNEAQFIDEKCDGKFIVENIAKKELVALLSRRGYASDPIRAWREANPSFRDTISSGGDSRDKFETTGPDFNYLLRLSLTKEERDQLLARRDSKMSELRVVKLKSPKTMWKDDLKILLDQLEKVEQNDKGKASMPKARVPTKERSSKKNFADTDDAGPPKKKTSSSSASVVFEDLPALKRSLRLSGKKKRNYADDDAGPPRKKTSSSSASMVFEVSPALKRSLRLSGKKKRNYADYDAGPPKEKTSSSSASVVFEVSPALKRSLRLSGKKKRNYADDDAGPPRKKTSSSSASMVFEVSPALKRSLRLSGKKKRNYADDDAGPPKKKTSSSSASVVFEVLPALKRSLRLSGKKKRNYADNDDAGPPKEKTSSSSASVVFEVLPALKRSLRLSGKKKRNYADNDDAGPPKKKTSSSSASVVFEDLPALKRSLRLSEKRKK